MPQTIEVQAFSFDELSDRAKERARDWLRECNDESDFECVIDDFKTIANLIGVSFKEHNVQLMGGKTRSEPNIYYSVACCQGDGACFEGNWAYDPAAVQTVRDHAPQDEKLHAIVDSLVGINSARILLNRPTLRATISHTGHYYHEHSISIDVTDGDDADDAVISDAEIDTVEEAIRDLCRWLYRQLRDQQDYVSSDEYIDDAMEANEYMFTEEGRRHAYA